ncbi:hypothetical protein D3C83_13300 [compost metagenome]
MVAREKPEEAAPRRQGAGKRFAVKAAPVQLRHEAAYFVHLQAVERRGADELDQRGDIAAVAARGVRA